MSTTDVVTALPAVSASILILTSVICYHISVRYNLILHKTPLICHTGAKAPAYYVFAPGLTMSAALMFIALIYQRSWRLDDALHRGYSVVPAHLLSEEPVTDADLPHQTQQQLLRNRFLLFHGHEEDHQEHPETAPRRLLLSYPSKSDGRTQSEDEGMDNGHDDAEFSNDSVDPFVDSRDVLSLPAVWRIELAFAFGVVSSAGIASLGICSADKDAWGARMHRIGGILTIPSLVLFMVFSTFASMRHRELEQDYSDLADHYNEYHLPFPGSKVDITAGADTTGSFADVYVNVRVNAGAGFLSRGVEGLVWRGDAKDVGGGATSISAAHEIGDGRRPESELLFSSAGNMEDEVGLPLIIVRWVCCCGAFVASVLSAYHFQKIINLAEQMRHKSDSKRVKVNSNCAFNGRDRMVDVMAGQMQLYQAVISTPRTSAKEEPLPKESPSSSPPLSQTSTTSPCASFYPSLPPSPSLSLSGSSSEAAQSFSRSLSSSLLSASLSPSPKDRSSSTGASAPLSMPLPLPLPQLVPPLVPPLVPMSLCASSLGLDSRADSRTSPSLPRLSSLRGADMHALLPADEKDRAGGEEELNEKGKEGRGCGDGEIDGESNDCAVGGGEETHEGEDIHNMRIRDTTVLLVDEQQQRLSADSREEDNDDQRLANFVEKTAGLRRIWQLQGNNGAFSPVSCCCGDPTTATQKTEQRRKIERRVQGSARQWVPVACIDSKGGAEEEVDTAGISGEGKTAVVAKSQSGCSLSGTAGEAAECILANGIAVPDEPQIRENSREKDISCREREEWIPVSGHDAHHENESEFKNGVSSEYGRGPTSVTASTTVTATTSHPTLLAGTVVACSACAALQQDPGLGLEWENVADGALDDPADASRNRGSGRGRPGSEEAEGAAERDTEERGECGEYGESGRRCVSDSQKQEIMRARMRKHGFVGALAQYVFAFSVALFLFTLSFTGLQ